MTKADVSVAAGFGHGALLRLNPTARLIRPPRGEREWSDRLHNFFGLWSVQRSLTRRTYKRIDNLTGLLCCLDSCAAAIL